MAKDRCRVDLTGLGYVAARGDLDAVHLLARNVTGGEGVALRLGVGQAEKLGRALLQQAEVARNRGLTRRAV